MERSLGKYIKQRRLELDLTQEQLAQRVGEGVDQAEISRLERDQVALPRRHRMEQLASALEIPLGLLLARSGWTGAEGIGSATGGDGASKEELQASIDALQANNAHLRASLQELLEEVGDLDLGVEEPDTMITREKAPPSHLRTILHEVDDAAAVVDMEGRPILRNAAYTALFGGDPAMVDAHGEPIAEDATPLQRAARRERFSMTFGLDRFGSRKWYWAEGKPMSTNEGEQLGIVTMREIEAPD